MRPCVPGASSVRDTAPFAVVRVYEVPMLRFAFHVMLSLSLILAACAQAANAQEEKLAAQPAAASHDAESGGHGAADHAEGVPLSFKADLALWSLIVFIVFLIVLKKFAWGPLSAALNKR